MEKGAHVWAIDSEGDDAWILYEVLSKTDTELKLQQLDKDSNVFSRARVDSKPSAGAHEENVEIRYDGVELANAKLSEADRAEGRDDDLITLPHLHEPAVLHAIHERFTTHGKIYTWTGPVLIAVNPFQRLPLYTNVSLVTFQREPHRIDLLMIFWGSIVHLACFGSAHLIFLRFILFSPMTTVTARKFWRAIVRRDYSDPKTSAARRGAAWSSRILHCRPFVPSNDVGQADFAVYPHLGRIRSREDGVNKNCHAVPHNVGVISSSSKRRRCR